MHNRFRKLMAIILMVLGILMIGRGLEYAIGHGLGWQGIVPAIIAGALVFALGFTRWRYLSQR
jgi:hypothetical protein